jgi:hypothetical protein
MRWRTGQNDHMKRTFVFVALAASVAAGSSSAARHDTRNAVTQVYLGTKFYGSITFVPPHDGYLTTWKLSQRIQNCAVDLDIGVDERGELYFESEGNDYFVAARRSATMWIVYGDDYGVGARRPQVGFVRRRPGTGRWDIYNRGRALGSARGRDGGAAGLALIGCKGRG